MKTSITAITVFVASALCAPTDGIFVTRDEQSSSGSSLSLAPATIAACQAAKNCEVYNNGGAIRFIPGQEPGTAAYDAIFPPMKRDVGDLSNLSKRSNFNTNLHMGSQVLGYGTTSPADALYRLWGACQYYSCDATPMNVDTKVQGCNTMDGCDENLIVTASGQYNGWAHRNNLVTALLDISGQGQQWGYVNWLVPQSTGNVYPSHWEVQQSGFFSVNIFSNGYMVAWIQVRITKGSEWDGGCQRVWDSLSAVSPAINGIGGGFFGSLLLSC